MHSRGLRWETGRSSRRRGEPVKTPLPSQAHKLLCVQGHVALSPPQTMRFLRRCESVYWNIPRMKQL